MRLIFGQITGTGGLLGKVRDDGRIDAQRPLPVPQFPCNPHNQSGRPYASRMELDRRGLRNNGDRRSPAGELELKEELHSELDMMVEGPAALGHGDHYVVTTLTACDHY
jgi:hypothetical protein